MKLVEFFAPDDVVVATKAGLTRSGPNEWHPDGHPDHIRQACEGSLRRLRLDAIPLYQLHRIDPEVPVEDSLGTLVELQAEGKVRHIGVSEVTVDELVKGVNIALGSLSLDQCPRFDCQGTGRVAIDCLIRAVGATLNGCTAEPTISPTVTSAAQTPTATPTRTTMPVPCGSFITRWGGLGSGVGAVHLSVGHRRHQ